MRRSNFVVGMFVVALMGLTAAGCENSGNLQAPRPDPVRGGRPKSRANYSAKTALSVQGRLSRRGTGAQRHRRQCLPLARIPRHHLVRAAALGRSLRRRDHHRLVRSAREPRRALQDDGLHPRQDAACGRRAGRRLSPGTQRRRPVGGSSHEPRKPPSASRTRFSTAPGNCAPHNSGNKEASSRRPAARCGCAGSLVML